MRSTTVALADTEPTECAVAGALASAADVLGRPRDGAPLESISLRGRLAPDPGCGLRLLRLAEDVASARHLRQRVQLAWDAFVVTFSSGPDLRP